MSFLADFNHSDSEDEGLKTKMDHKGFSSSSAKKVKVEFIEKSPSKPGKHFGVLSNGHSTSDSEDEDPQTKMKENIDVETTSMEQKMEPKSFTNEVIFGSESFNPVVDSEEIKSEDFAFSNEVMTELEVIYQPEENVEIKLEPFDPIGVPSTSAMEFNNLEDTTLEPAAKIANKKTENIRAMWNMERIILDLHTEEQCIQFSEAVGLVPMVKVCRRHRKNCRIVRKTLLGYFACSKCGKRWSRTPGTWFEDCKLPLPTIFRIMYCFGRDYDYYNTQIECFSQARDKIISSSTICEWFSYCRETIVAYELDHMESREKIGGENKIVIVDESMFGERKFAKGKDREGHWVLAMFDLRSFELRLETCPVNEAFAEVQLPIIKHVEPGSIIHTSSWPAYDGLEVHGYTHKIVTTKNGCKNEPGTSSNASEVSSNSQMSNWSFLKKRFNKAGNHPGNFEDMLIEFMWRQTIKRKQLDPFVELLKAIKYVYKVYICCLIFILPTYLFPYRTL